MERDHNYDDEYLRSTGIRLGYGSRYQTVPGLREGVLLEVGFADVEPNKPVGISSWALDHSQASGVDFTDNRALGVKCYMPSYTFVEKLQAISTKFRRFRDGGNPAPADFLRHYYDVHQLLAQPDVLAFIGSPEYQAKKKRHFSQSDNLNISENEAFTMTNAATRALFSDEFEKTSSLYHNGKPTFEETLARIAEHAPRL